MQIKSIGIDLGKTTFHVVALDSRCQVVVRKKFLPTTTVELHGESGFLPYGDGSRCGSHVLEVLGPTYAFRHWASPRRPG